MRVLHDTERHVITTESVVLEIHFDTRVLWMTSVFPEGIMLTNQGFTVFPTAFLELVNVPHPLHPPVA